ncbi:MAG: dihydroorotase, partial [Magnetococcales bacterium]|nr:dihydroorotase [Magnetococcales bacterium]
MSNPEWILLRGGRVIDPSSQWDATADLLIGNQRVVAMGKNLDRPSQCLILDVDGLVVSPGLVDMHTHMREPGFEHKETIAGGLSSALAGGVTSLAAMPNTKPNADHPEIISFMLEKARQAGRAHLYPIGAITKGSNSEELTDMQAMLTAGCVAFSDDGKVVKGSGMMRRALEAAKAVNALIIQHAEDPTLAPDGCMHEGEVSRRMGVVGIPSASEDIIVDRDIRLVALTGGRYHVSHLSTAGSLHAVAAAKQAGLPVTCEVTPHHLVLTDEAVLTHGTHAKMSPPLRGEQDRLALLEGMARGTIDAIATDHAPHEEASKAVEFSKASNGVVGLETMLPIALQLVEEGVLSLSDCLAKMTINPARLLSIPRGSLAVGALADVVVFDPSEAWVVDANRFQGKGRNCCFQGRKVRGRVKMTLVDGI